jgi:calcineurin-like phosphoesterase family protein
MTTEVIILAQGTQKRLGPGAGYKQLLPLPGCGNVPILVRTIRQLDVYDHAQRDLGSSLHITLLTWRDLYQAMADLPELDEAMIQLPDPGNSSLKGIARYLELRGAKHWFDARVVLLGDVVYSWKCLEALFALSGSSGFVGTRDVSEGAGELWGVAWARSHEEAMMVDLRDALLRHPPFDDEYQPGQLRRWITGMRRGELALHVASLGHKGRYTAIDDYTMDVDVPSHIPKLGPASEAAAQDDACHDLTWKPSP